MVVRPKDIRLRRNDEDDNTRVKVGCLIIKDIHIIHHTPHADIDRQRERETETKRQ